MQIRFNRMSIAVDEAILVTRIVASATVLLKPHSRDNLVFLPV